MGSSSRSAPPLVSVVIPTHNRPQMLAEALGRVRAQTFTDSEILVLSNGENANMLQASRAVATAYGRCFELAAANVSVARNFGIARPKGEWIAFLDDDDLWLHQLEWLRPRTRLIQFHQWLLGISSVIKRI